MAVVAQFGKRLFRTRFLQNVLQKPSCCRLFSQSKEMKLTGVFLNNKAHLKIGGKDAAHFLNGLVTNDIYLFHCDAQMAALYCMMLNVKGRVLYDMFLYKLNESIENAEFLLECDSDALPNIIKTFKIYKLRSKVEFADVSDQFSSWVVIQEDADECLTDYKRGVTPVIAVKDPRLSVLGARLVLPKNEKPSNVFGNMEDSMDASVYDAHRVRLGVSEGIKDIEPGVPLPLEYNITELHGVSYQKGCYIGQELTARSHHTGVIRKRIMPLKLDTTGRLEKDAAVKTNKGKAAGKLKSIYGNIGLGLMRLDTVKSADSLSVVTTDGTSVSVMVDWPTWWSHK